MRRWLPAGLTLVLASGVALNACSSPASVKAPALPSPSPTALPGGWTRTVDAGQGFVVATPATWPVVLRDSANFDADVAAVAAQSPELGQYFKDSFTRHDQLRLLAADPGGLQQGFATNVNVMISDLGATATAPTLDDVAAAKVKRLKTPPGTTSPVTEGRDKLSAVPAVALDYTITPAGQGIRVRSILATIERGGRRYLVELTMGAAPGGADALFVAEQRLFRLVTPT